MFYFRKFYMKSNHSFLDHAHLAIMAVTLVVACAGSALRFQQISQDHSYTWFGYAPASIQPFVPVEYQIPMQMADMHTATKPAI